jgi:hypothetical protein
VRRRVFLWATDGILHVGNPLMKSGAHSGVTSVFLLSLIELMSYGVVNIGMVLLRAAAL